MLMVGKTKVYTTGEIFDLKAFVMGVGRLNVVMGARPVFWTIAESGQCFVTFVKVPACCTDVEIVAECVTRRNQIAIEIRKEDVSADVMRAFRNRLRCTEKLYQQHDIRDN